MFHWELLKKTALLGTERHPLATEALPASIQEILAKSNKNDAEGYFLKAAALLYNYNRAGQNPSKITLPNLALEDAETSTFCPPKTVALWKKVLDLSPANPYLLELLLQNCHQKNWVLTDDLLVNALSNTPKQLLPQLHLLLGVRGKWLAQFNETWQITDVSMSITQWEEGKPTERKAFLSELRRQNPAEALSLLAQAWPNESAKDRKSLLSTLKVGLSANDEPFLEQIHEELTKNLTSPKPVTLEAIHLINELRLSIQGSPFGKEVAEQIAKCITKKKGLLSAIGFSSANYQLQLPDYEMDFWNGNEMNQRFGFDKLSSQKGVSDAEYWLQSLLRWLHPSHLIKFFEGNLSRLVDFFVNTQSKNAAAYLYAFSEAMVYASPDEIKAFLKVTAHLEVKKADLLQRLPWPDQEELLLHHFQLSFALVKAITTEDPPQNWSLQFSKKALISLVKELDGSNYYYVFSDRNFLNQLGRKLHVSAKNLLYSLQNELSQDWQRNYWNTQFADILFKQLEIKEEIEQITAQ
ncbi:DUF5691 domain-containing protein [Runella sp. SP2]|uniref:DUF5691 domain-containing protein n=1 Tax=Runella sp. SP2 TaxID=2268026 RepID=UPI000F073948|nr:DUF5691 domain-containing protein [Runella sp. SP2]AYQ32386.1 hypothetical protein DTQ70_09460 [Runella sp. SP2]